MKVNECYRCGATCFCDRCDGPFDTPPIDVSRFHKGPMTEEQCKQWLGKWLLIVVKDDIGDVVYAMAHPWKRRNGFILDCTDEFGNTYPPSKVQLWYPLPEVT